MTCQNSCDILCLQGGDTINKNIGKILKESRISSGISVKEISELLINKGYKASESTIYSWENENSQPTPGAFLVMCSAYGITNVLTTFGFDGYNEDGSIRLNINEINVIEKYRALDPHGKEMVDFTLLKEWERSTTEAKTAEKVFQMTVQKDTTYVDAAHDDENSTLEERQADDRMMMDDSEWE